MTQIFKNYPTILIFILLLVIMLINSLHFFYPDEFVKIVGGNFINHGKLPYRDFFSNHGPVGYFFTSLVTLFSGSSFVKFRLTLAVFYFLLILSFYLYILKRFAKIAANLFLVFALFIGLIATYVWGHMLLADSLSGYLITPVYILIFFIIFNKDSFRIRDIVLISILSAATVLTSLTYIYAVIIVYLITTFYFIKVSPKSLSNIIRFLLILATPYLIFLIYLVLTNSLSDWYFQTVVLVKDSYLASYGGLSVKNPMRLAITLFANFFDNYRAILIQTKDLNLGNPFAHSLALADFLMIIYLIIKRKFSLAIFVAGMLIYLNARSNPYSTGDTDYQAIPYHYFSLFNGIYLLSSVWSELGKKAEDNKRYIYGFILIFLGLYFIFLALFLFNHAFEKAYKKYMGTQALIYDRPAIANTLNSLLTKDDYYYIGPFEPQENLYMKAKLASKWYFLIPPMDQSEKVKFGVLGDIQKNKPKVVVFNTSHYIFGSLPGSYLVDYLKNNYFTLEQLKDEGLEFEIKNNQFGNFSLSHHFFFDKSRKDEVIKDLIKQGLISTPVEKNTPQDKKLDKKN